MRYAVRPPFRSRTYCHCRSCRGTTGSACVAWFTAAGTAFSWTAGEPRGYASSSHAVRDFCANCGTQLTFRDARRPDEIDVTTSSLDEPGGVLPEDHTWASQALGSLPLGGGLPEHRKERSGEG
ncbi:MAG: GFA family protein [Myxococcota bacterium]